MSILLRNLMRLAARKIAADPVVRDKAAQVAQNTANEAKKIMRDEDPSRAAGRAVGRALRKIGIE